MDHFQPMYMDAVFNFRKKKNSLSKHLKAFSRIHSIWKISSWDLIFSLYFLLLSLGTVMITMDWNNIYSWFQCSQPNVNANKSSERFTFSILSAVLFLLFSFTFSFCIRSFGLVEIASFRLFDSQFLYHWDWAIEKRREREWEKDVNAQKKKNHCDFMDVSVRLMFISC